MATTANGNTPTTEPRGRGRPFGSVKVFDSVLKKELEHDLHLNRRIRKSIELTLDRMEKLGKEASQDLTTQVSILKSLETLSAARAKGLEVLAKHSEGIQEVTARTPAVVERDVPAKSAATMLEELDSK